jgi:hypothetical protein
MAIGDYDSGGALTQSDESLPILDEIVGDGLVTLEKIHVVIYERTGLTPRLGSDG